MTSAGLQLVPAWAVMWTVAGALFAASKFLALAGAPAASAEFAVFDSCDWPPRRLIAAGHVLLNCLFLFLAVTYLGLVVWRVA